MGHVVPAWDAYREKISDERLRSVCEHVRVAVLAGQAGWGRSRNRAGRPSVSLPLNRRPSPLLVRRSCRVTAPGAVRAKSDLVPI